MTFQCTTKDQNGTPVGGILITGNVLETGLSFQRSSDGNGYSDLAMINVPVGEDVLISVIATGYAVWTGYFKTTEANQQVSITLVPFV